MGVAFGASWEPILTGLEGRGFYASPLSVLLPAVRGKAVMGGVWQRWEALVSKLLGPVSTMQALEPGTPGSTPSSTPLCSMRRDNCEEFVWDSVPHL